MIKAILGVVVGYVVMAAVIFGTFTAAYEALGVDGAFEAGTYDPTIQWIVVSLFLGSLAAVAGGAVARAISPIAPPMLAAVVLIAGLGLAAFTVSSGTAASGSLRLGDVSTAEAMQQAQQPTWLLFVNPLVGAVFVILGARARGGKK